MLKELLRSWQLSRKKEREEAEWKGGGALLAWPTTAASLQITMEILIFNWTHKFQKRTGLDAKANLELYKSNRVCSVFTGANTCSILTHVYTQYTSTVHEYTMYPISSMYLHLK